MKKGYISWLLNDEQGAVAALVAICMVMLLGVTSLAVDYGTLASNRQSLQNAADAAALAGAMKMSSSRSHGEIHSEAVSYADKNGADAASGECELLTAVSGDTVTVTIKKQVRTGLSMVLTGRDVETVSAKATAETSTIFGNYPYAMFAGQSIEERGTGIEITGNNITIGSPIHSNSHIDMPHATLTNGAVATAVGNTGHSGVAGWESAPEIPMPNYESIKSSFPNVVEYPGNLTLKKNNYSFATFLNDMIATSGKNRNQLKREGLTIYVSGTVTYNGNGAYTNDTGIPINLIAYGEINLNGCALTSTAAAPFVIISETGDITVNGQGADYHGIVYAPNGDVTLNGGNATFTGSIIAQNIRKTGGKISVQYYDGADDYTPKGKVRLVE